MWICLPSFYRNLSFFFFSQLIEKSMACMMVNIFNTLKKKIKELSI